eukprot:4601284-Prymnesium_polylepis.1
MPPGLSRPMVFIMEAIRCGRAFDWRLRTVRRAGLLADAALRGLLGDGLGLTEGWRRCERVV